MNFDIFYNFDYTILSFFSKFHSSILTPINSVLSFLGSTKVYVAMLIFFFALLFTKKYRRMALVILGSLGFSIVLTSFIFKNVFVRIRPYIYLADDPIFMGWWKEVGCVMEDTFSMPSGHATRAFALAFAGLYLSKKKYRFLFPVLAILIGFSRIYFMVHWPTDIIGGIISGLLAFIIGTCVAEPLYKWSNITKVPFIVTLREIDVLKKKQ